MEDNKNMELYDFFCTPPNGVLKPIEYGPLKGKSDINPQWRYEVLTQKLGPCGIGWKFTVDSHWTQEVPQTGELMVFVLVSLYVKQGDNWGEGIPAYGGDYLIKKDKNGYHGNDEALKMAITDALGTACKYVGVAADVYRGLLNNVKVAADTKYSKRAENAQNAPQQEQKKTTTNNGNAPKPPQQINDTVMAKAVERLNGVIKGKGLSKNYLVSTAEKVIGKKSVADMTTEEVLKLAEVLEYEE